MPNVIIGQVAIGAGLHQSAKPNSVGGHAAAPVPTPPPAQSFDLTGYSTLALAIVTFLLACVALWQAVLSRISISESKRETERSFGLQQVHQTELITPILIAEATAKRTGAYRFLSLRNVGQGPAINVRFSGLLDGLMFSAAQYSVAAVGSGGAAQTLLVLSRNHEARDPINELLIRYEDIFGNIYSTAYQRFAEDSEWYVWSRPWIGEELGVPRPPNCSEDPPEWGRRSQVYYDAEKGLF